jgi:hypothetical protein
MTSKERLERILFKYGLVGGLPAISGLAGYLIAHGIIAPHCKVGDTIYRVHPIHNIICEWVIIEIIITEDEINYIDDSDNLIKGEDIGKTVFLTEEDAERALAERNGNEHE